MSDSEKHPNRPKAPIPRLSDVFFCCVITFGIAMCAASVYGAVTGDMELFMAGVTADCCIAAFCMLLTLTMTVGR